jgi:hypothetical protein
MKLYVETMDATILEVDSDGRVRLEKDGWSVPTLQERRAIIYAAQTEAAALEELIDILQRTGQDPGVGNWRQRHQR